MVQYSKKSLMRHYNRSSEDSNTKSYAGPGSRGFKGEQYFNWPEDHYCNILAKNTPEAKLKSNGKLFSAEEVSRYPNIDCVVRLLVIIPRQVYDKKEQMGH